MSTNPNRRRSRSTRLRARDYASPGAYYVTLCAENREILFGDVVDGIMYLNDAGHAAESFWKAIPKHFPHAVLDEFKVMPNHIHGIIWIVDGVNGAGTDRPRGNVSAKGGYVGANDYSPLQDPPAVTKIHDAPRRHPNGTSRTIGSMVRGFKIAVTRRMRSEGRRDPVWQRNYHDHIIRNERSLERIRKYIRDNPANWHRDRNNPDRKAWLPSHLPFLFSLPCRSNAATAAPHSQHSRPEDRMPPKKPAPKKIPAKSAKASKPKTIAEYIDRAPPEAQKNLRALYAVLKKVAPKATEAIKWSSPVFEEGRILFAFSAHKTHINFVPTPATVAAFRDELKGYTVGKMAVSLPHGKPVPRALIGRMAAWRLRDVRENDARWM